MYNIYKMADLDFMGFYQPPLPPPPKFGTTPECGTLKFRFFFVKRGARSVVMIAWNHFPSLIVSWRKKKYLKKNLKVATPPGGGRGHKLSMVCALSQNQLTRFEN